MNFTRGRGRRTTVLVASTAAGLLAVSGVAYADNIQDTIADSGSVTLEAGSTVGDTAGIRVVGNNSDGATTDAGCNWDTGEQPLVLDVITPAGVTATPDPVSITECGNDGEVTVTFTASSTAVSGVATVSIVSTPAGGGGYSNQVSIPITVNRPSDGTAPAGSVMINDGADWTNNSDGDVTVDLAATDNVGIVKYRLANSQAGLDAETVTEVPVSPATAALTVNDRAFGLDGTEGASKEVWVRYYDAVGNYVNASDTIGWDKTSPVITDAGPTTSPNAAGWYKTDVVNTFDLTETGSGPDASCAAAFPSDSQTKITSGEGTAVTVLSDGCTDLAGNSASAVSSGEFKVDKTAPTVSVTGVTALAQYLLGEAPSADCQTTDSLSDVKTHASLTSSGGPLGLFTATCSGAEDNAGNTASPVAVSYSVVYDWDGFFQPIDNVVNEDGSTPAATAAGWNRAKAGSAIPVKFSLAGDRGLGIFQAGYPVAKRVTCPSGTLVADTVEETATATTSGLKYDALADQYNYTWKTSTGYAGTCQRLEVKLVDGTSHYAFFNFVK